MTSSRCSPTEQLARLESVTGVLPFGERYAAVGEGPLVARSTEIFQLNLGKLCNQTCKHCHVDAGPTRREIMTRETMRDCLAAIGKFRFKTVDLTGGAPEMNPDFKWFVTELRALGAAVIVRSNLTILEARGFEGFAAFFAAQRLTVVSSLPHYTASTTDRQRGVGVFEKSIAAIRKLNALGYGRDDTGLELNLVYNPVGAFLPPRQESLEADYRRELSKHFGVSFNHLYTITNMPIRRYLDYLVQSGNFDSYLQKLAALFNPAAAQNVMCRNTISVGWDGALYDCDFNQMLELKLAPGLARHVRDLNEPVVSNRPIVTRKHCYGCTAGSGSSCGGTTA